MRIRGEAGITMGRPAPFLGSATTSAIISRERDGDRRSQGSYHQRLVQSLPPGTGNICKIRNETCKDNSTYI